MRLHTTLMTAAAALAIGLSPALAAEEMQGTEAPGAKSDITIVERDAGNAPGSNVESSGSSANEGTLTAPEKSAPDNAPGTTGGATDSSSANVPGAAAEGDDKNENQGALSAPEKDAKEGKMDSGTKTY